MTSQSDAPGAQVITVRDDMGPLEFVGETVADLSWSYDEAYERGHTRWTDITLYRVLQDGAQYKYVIQIVGRSVLYHRLNGPCHRGVNVPVGLVRQDDERYQSLDPCPNAGCQPADLEEFGDNDIVSVEENLYTLYKCPTADYVVEVMYERGGRDRKSGLSQKLLQAASRFDKDIENALKKTRTL